MQVANAFRALALFFCRGEGWKKHCRENRDYRDDHQKFNKCEGPFRARAGRRTHIFQAPVRGSIEVHTTLYRIIWSKAPVIPLLGGGRREMKAIWNLVIGAFLGFGVWDLELPPAGFWFMTLNFCPDLCMSRNHLRPRNHFKPFPLHASHENPCR